jgi:hypothetical protein
MEQLPTAPAEAPDTPAVSRALARIAAAKEGADAAETECLDAVADLVRAHGDPVAVFDSVLAQLAREQVRVTAAAYGLRLYSSTEASVDDGHATEVLVFWPSFAIVPHGQKPVDTLTQLRARIAEREEEHRLSADFQAKVASGHVGDVSTWFGWMRSAAR